MQFTIPITGFDILSTKDLVQDPPGSLYFQYSTGDFAVYFWVKNKFGGFCYGFIDRDREVFLSNDMSADEARGFRLIRADFTVVDAPETAKQRILAALLHHKLDYFIFPDEIKRVKTLLRITLK